MDWGERLPKSKLGMNEWYPLDKMAVGKLSPLCISEQGLGGSGSRWMEGSRKRLTVMEAGSLSLTAAMPPIRPANGWQLVFNMMIYRNLNLTSCIWHLHFCNPSLEGNLWIHGTFKPTFFQLVIACAVTSHTESALGGNIYSPCVTWGFKGDFIWVPIYNEADTSLHAVPHRHSFISSPLNLIY